MAKQQFGDMVKAVVDVTQGIMAIGGELHSDEEAVLLDQGSLQRDLWGINLYPEQPAQEWIEFDSMINVRPPTSSAEISCHKEMSKHCGAVWATTVPSPIFKSSRHHSSSS